MSFVAKFSPSERLFYLWRYVVQLREFYGNSANDTRKWEVGLVKCEVELGKWEVGLGKSKFSKLSKFSKSSPNAPNSPNAPSSPNAPNAPSSPNSLNAPNSPNAPNAPNDILSLVGTFSLVWQASF